jgi:uncharacterized protein YlxW (UPF0749 family)
MPLATSSDWVNYSLSGAIAAIITIIGAFVIRGMDGRVKHNEEWERILNAVKAEVAKCQEDKALLQAEIDDLRARVASLEGGNLHKRSP